MGAISTALLWIILFRGWGANYCNFGLCCQQPQRPPKAMMETLLAVAFHRPDGRVVVVSTLPLRGVCPHKAEQSRQPPSLLCWSSVVLSVSVPPSLHPASSFLIVNLRFPFLPFMNPWLNGLFLPKDVPKSR